MGHDERTRRTAPKLVFAQLSDRTEPISLEEHLHSHTLGSLIQRAAATTPSAGEESRAGSFRLGKDAAMMLIERFWHQLTAGTRVHEVNVNTTVGEIVDMFLGESDIELPLQSKARGGTRCRAADSGDAAWRR